jgi:hypothetical protein
VTTGLTTNILTKNTMARDEKFVSGYISAAEIEYAVRRNMRLASIVTSDEEKTALTESANILRKVIKNVVFTLYDDGKIESEEWHNDFGEVSRMGGPAMQSYFKDGTVNVEQWFLNGKRHRIGGPADVGHYADNGKLRYETWYLDGEIHRSGGPAFMTYDTTGEMNEMFETFY